MKQEKLIKFLLITYSVYCSFIIGMSWDEAYYHEIGKINLKYLLSFGQINEPFIYKYRFSTLYWSVSSLISQIFPNKFNLEIYHFINTFFGLMTIVGLYKINKILFNKSIAKISSFLLFFTPFFFGHLAINNKDVILAFAHVWIIYYIYKYTFFNYNYKKKFLLIFKISLLSAIGTGIQLLFLGSLVPIIFIFLTILILYKKKELKIIFFDFIVFLFIFYFILILFWVDTHSNILLLPYEFINKSFSMEIGWPFNLLNGIYLDTNNTPYNYLIINYFYKLPEFLIFLYIIFIPILFLNKEFLLKNFKNFRIIIILAVFLLTYPTLVMALIPYPIYDGLRLFLWSTPYLVIIPSITMYLIFIKSNIFLNFIKIFLTILIFFHIINFLTITPYHYTFLNYFSGDKEYRYKKFENDYWSTSLKELIFTSNLGNGKINFFSCGVSPGLAKFYMKQRYKRSEYTHKKNASYVIMTNRTLFSKKDNKITNCYDEYSTENVHQVTRNGIILSVIKKNDNNE